MHVTLFHVLNLNVCGWHVLEPDLEKWWTELVEYDIIVPIGSVPYKKTFTDETITRVADYIKMHLDYYYGKKQV